MLVWICSRHTRGNLGNGLVCDFSTQVASIYEEFGRQRPRGVAVAVMVNAADQYANG